MTEIARPSPWLDKSFGARAKITISKDLAVGSTQANYPFKLTSLHNVIYGLSRSDGQDIVVTDSGGVTELERDVASFDRLSRAAELYIKLPSLSSAIDSVIYLYFNNPSYYRGNDKVDRSITRRIRVAASADDAMVQWTGAAWGLYATQPNILGYNGATSNKRGFGMRFLNTLIPLAALINRSYIIYTCSIANAEVVINSRLCVEYASQPATFSDIANYQGRRGTACGGASDVNHTATLDINGIAAIVLDTEYSTPSLNTPIQSAVNNSYKKDMVIFHDDHDARGDLVNNHIRTYYSYDGSTTKCPLLICNFTPVVTNYQTIELQYLGLEGNL